MDIYRTANQKHTQILIIIVHIIGSVAITPYITTIRGEFST